MQFEILSVINWDDDEWQIVYRYQGTLRSTKVFDNYRPSNSSVIKHLQEIHHG